MVACTPELTTALAQDPVTVSEHLLAKGLIPHTLHSQLVHSGDAPRDKARQLVEAMTTCTKTNSSNFDVFIIVLKKQGGWTKNIISILTDTFFTTRVKYSS